MSRRHPRALPRLWMMTDERQGDALFPALRRLPRGSGVVFRHGRTATAERAALLRRVRRVAQRRGLVLVVAGGASPIVAQGAHGWTALRRGRQLRTVSAHDAGELVRAARIGADLAFLSPLYPTRTHPGARALGRVRFGLLARRARLPVVALGGMTGPLRIRGVHGWAAIDALTDTRQKRKAVPT